MCVCVYNNTSHNTNFIILYNLEKYRSLITTNVACTIIEEAFRICSAFESRQRKIILRTISLSFFSPKVSFNLSRQLLRACFRMPMIPCHHYKPPRKHLSHKEFSLTQTSAKIAKVQTQMVWVVSVI